MINEQVMADTVSRMLEAGIDEPTILSTLVDTGLTQEEAQSIISKVQAPKQAAPEPAPTPQNDLNLMRAQIDSAAQTTELHETTTHTMLNEHADKLDSMNQKVDEVKQVVTAAVSANENSPLNYRVSVITAKLDDISAQSKAQLDLLQKILETNRRILTELEAQK